MKTKAQLREQVAAMFNQGSDLIPSCTLRRETPGVYDPNAGGPAAPVVVTDTGRVLFTNGILAKRIAQGREVEANAQGAYATGFTTLSPNEGDRLIVDGTDWRVGDADDLLLAGALWELVLVPE